MTTENTDTPLKADCSSAPCSASDILVEIKAELARAMAKFPNWPTDALHAVGVVAEEMGELQKEVLQLAYEPHKSSKEWVRKEALQTAAMAIRFLMSLDRYEFAPGPQHPQQNAEQSPIIEQLMKRDGYDNPIKAVMPVVKKMRADGKDPMLVLAVAAEMAYRKSKESEE